MICPISKHSSRLVWCDRNDRGALLRVFPTLIALYRGDFAIFGATIKANIVVTLPYEWPNWDCNDPCASTVLRLRLRCSTYSGASHCILLVHNYYALSLSVSVCISWQCIGPFLDLGNVSHTAADHVYHEHRNTLPFSFAATASNNDYILVHASTSLTCRWSWTRV